MSVRFASKVTALVKNTSNCYKQTTKFRYKSATTTANANAAGKDSVKATTTATAEAAASKSAATSSSSSSTSSSQSSAPLLNTAIAATLGIATVAVSATIVENATAGDVPPFDPSGERFDQSSFKGRFCKMMLACDPRLLTYTEDETRRAKEMVDDYKNLIQSVPADASTGMSDNDIHHALWEALRISSASLHPDTGDTIPQPFRMSGYVPFNGPMCVAMVASTSTPSLLFWSWLNQSQNALVNYYNRNACSEMTNETLLKSYSAAVVSALSVAFGLATVIQKKFDAQKAKQLMRWVAFPSAVVASSLNCYIVRSPEITSGVPLVNADGEDVAPGHTSKIAATNGVNSTTASRALLQAPVYFLPPLLMGSIPLLKNAVMRNPAISVPMTTYLVLVSFGLGLPATVAIFPQMAEIDVKDVEEEFQGLTGKDGLPYQKYYYNKGL